MAETVGNIVLEQLRPIRDEISSGVAQLDRRRSSMEDRPERLEAGQQALQGGVFGPVRSGHTLTERVENVDEKLGIAQ